MTIEIYQTPKGASALPGSTRFAYRRFLMLGATPAGPYADYWRGPGAATGLTVSNQGTTGANFVYQIDLVRQIKNVSWNFTGFSSLCIMVIEQVYGGAPPLLATGEVEPPETGLIISRYFARWGVANWANANSGHVGGFWIGPASSGSITFVGLTTAAANGYIGFVRTNLGNFFGYKPVGGAAVLTPLVHNHTQWAHFEHRLIVATITTPARYELLINGIVRAQVSFLTPGTPRYAALNNGVSPVMASGNNGGFDTNVTMLWRDWEVIRGRNEESTY